MKKHIIFLSALACLLAGCSSVAVKTLPGGAQISVKGTPVATKDSMAAIRRPFLFNTEITVSHDGYEPRRVAITPKSADMTVVLERRITIGTTPAGALVTSDDGRAWGTTPCTVLLPADSQPVGFLITKDGYIPLTTRISPPDSAPEISLALLKDGPGRYQYTFAYGISGFPYLEKQTVPLPALDSAMDNATCIMTFPDDHFPYALHPIAPTPEFLLTLVCPRKNAGPDKLTSRLFKLDITHPKLLPLSDGTYFEHQGVIRDGNFFFLSRKTGRPDIWQATTCESTDNAALHTTNNTVKQHLDYTPNGHRLLMTAFLPEEPNHPQIHIINANATDKPAQIILCDGQNAHWAADGNRVVFENETPSRIFTITADSAHLTPIAPLDSPHCDKDPDWSPDGKSIVFASNRQNEKPEDFDIWLYDCAAKSVRKITDSAAIDDMPHFTPDGTAVVFRSNRKNAWGLWRVTP